MEVTDNARYDLESGRDVVRLNFTHTILSDNGVWRCEASAESEQYIVGDGMLTRVNSAVVGMGVQHDIQLTIIGKSSSLRSALNHQHLLLALLLHSSSWSATHSVCR